MIATRRLVLRPLVAADAGWIFRTIRHPDVQRWLTSPPHPYRIEDARAYIAAKAGLPAYRVITRDGVGLGMVTLTPDDETAESGSGTVDLGYWLRVDAWGQGIMTEAAGALLKSHDANSGGCVNSGWIEGNTASERVLAKLGFVRTGVVETRQAHFLGRAVPVIRAMRPAAGKPGTG
ncbi:GNAT family N-acetyltransferase [Thalassococcus sp. CAU 1522]|uniref:GNAT family N-acetyltransferase n=1 Tax=Thalassococcus arenae TaxID=2851652 RepID=A0ABS6NB83_9RHOB|nr:GNAT family N-acetyltransferase [Thalassococcus arenae]MBV2360795.1 GNAT family N-acetyltransferase [Thalassococcus arenae]